MRVFKKSISIILISSILITSNSFNLFADNLSEETIIETMNTLESNSFELSSTKIDEETIVEDNDDVSQFEEESCEKIISEDIMLVATSSEIELDDIDSYYSNYVEEPEEDSLASPSNVSFIDDTIEEEIEIATMSIAETDSDMELGTISEVNSLHSKSLFGVGETYWFGTFPQNDGNAKQLEPIPWKLLNVEDDGTALFTTYTLVYPSYFNEEVDVNVTWRDCDLRDWLNDYFFNKAFSNNQKNSDLLVDKEAVTDGETYNLGKIFILDIDQVNAYLSYYLDKILEATEWANTVGIGTSNWWWLRNRAGETDWGKVTFVDHEGEIRSSDGEIMNKPTMGIRPAIYLKTSSSMYKPGNLTWDLDGGSFKEQSRLWNDMNNYFAGQKLPTAVNVTPPAGKIFRGWKINNSNVLYTEIPTNQTGDITIKPVWDTLSLRYYDRYFGTDLTTYFENFNPDLVNRPNGKFPYEADYNNGEIIEDFYIRKLFYKDSQGNFQEIQYEGDITEENHIVYVMGNRGVLPPYMRQIDSIELNTNRVVKSYTEGSGLNVSGLVVKVNLITGNEIYVTYGDEMSQFFTITPSPGQTLSTNNRVVTVEFGGFTATYNITVNKSGGGGPSGGGGGTGGGGGVIKPIQEAIFRNPFVLNNVIQTNKTIKGTVNMSDSKWIKDESTGKWMLMTKELDGRNLVLADGFYETISYENGKVKADTYYFNIAGELVTGWVQTIDNNKYFFEVDYNANEGKMVKGWKVVEGKWYFFGDDGAMYRYTMTPDGYLVDANGEYVGQSVTK